MLFTDSNYRKHILTKRKLSSPSTVHLPITTFASDIGLVGQDRQSSLFLPSVQSSRKPSLLRLLSSIRIGLQSFHLWTATVPPRTGTVPRPLKTIIVRPIFMPTSYVPCNESAYQSYQLLRCENFAPRHSSMIKSCRPSNFSGMNLPST